MADCGIYKLYFSNPNKFYIGSSANLSRRLGKHTSYLKNNNHPNKHLQSAYNLDKTINFEIIEQCSSKLLIEREQFYIDSLKPSYNILPKAYTCLGRINTKEHNIKISIANKKVWTEEKKKEFVKKRKGIKYNYKKPMTFHPKSEQGLKITRDKRRQDSNITKLNIEKVKDIKRMLLNKETVTSCAKKYGVCRSTIQTIIQGRSWFDVTI